MHYTERDKILMQVQKPTRYTGGELNACIKDKDKVKIRFGFCFPDLYEIAMSHLGIKILYHTLNKREDTYCERVFAPWTDMEEHMRSRNMKLFALETGDEVCDFDFLGFTLQYELSYSNVVNMLNLADVPLYSAERTKDHPFVCAGGPCAYNAEPVADFIDFFVLGEGEEIIHEIMDEYNLWEEENGTREDFLHRIAKIQGIYVPSFYDVSYNPDGTISEITPNTSDAPEKIKKRIVTDFSNCFTPEEIIVPFGEIVHDRAVLEVFRGCIRGCRFCQAGYVYRPVRERDADRLLKIAESLLNSSGYDEISLSSLSTSDYRDLPKLTDNLINITEQKKINLSLPSLRIDNFSMELMNRVQKVRKSGITFAPEAGTQRLRDVINKNITEEDITSSVRMLFKGGYTNVKLYFMLGLPTETDEDVSGIAELAEKVLSVYFETPKEERAKNINITVSTSNFIPKPFTAFQWERQITRDEMTAKQDILKASIKSKRIRYNWHDSKTSYLEGVFARGDRRLAPVIKRAVELGCKFDGWGEYFRFDLWMQAFEDCGIDPDFYTSRERSYGEVLPWDHIDVGVTKSFLQRESEKARKAETTANCREKCAGCGAASFNTGVCYE